MTTKRHTMMLFACPAVFALVACADSKPPEAPPPASTTTTTTTMPGNSVTETPRQASTSGNIQIAQDILTACGIAAADAFFPYDSARLEKKDIKPLNDVAGCFTTGPLKGRQMKLVGRADPRGATGYNVALGQARADSVQKYLIDRGLSQSSATSTSRGALDATGTDDAGWARDRRVDIMLGG